MAARPQKVRQVPPDESRSPGHPNPHAPECALRRGKEQLFYSVVTRHCHKCGTTYTLSGQPGRTETCERCGADLKVCANCMYYDLQVAYQCRERRAEPVGEKHMANFCEWFEFAKRVWGGKTEDARENAARENLKKLFGD
jgi:hypothetical protein